MIWTDHYSKQIRRTTDGEYQILWYFLILIRTHERRSVWPSASRSTTCPPFERSSKRRRGFPSETHVKRGERIVHGDKELVEKLGRNDPCPCGSGRRFEELLPAFRPL